MGGLLLGDGGKPERDVVCCVGMDVSDEGALLHHTLDRIMEMAWEDRTPFEAIEVQFGLKENEVRALMRRHMLPSSFVMWRKRVKGRKTKHQKNLPKGRFRSKNQRSIA